MEEAIISIVREIGDVGKVAKDDHLIDNLGFDSLKLLFLISKVESTFHIVIKDHDLDIVNFLSVTAIVNLVKKYQG